MKRRSLKLAIPYQGSFFDLNLQRIRDLLVTMNPDVVFNLVEGVEGKAELIYFPTALLESLNIPYSGCRLDSMYLTSNKVYAKEKMRANGLPTADWFSAKRDQQAFAGEALYHQAFVGRCLGGY